MIEITIENNVFRIIESSMFINNDFEDIDTIDTTKIYLMSKEDPTDYIDYSIIPGHNIGIKNLYVICKNLLDKNKKGNKDDRNKNE